MRRRRWVKVVRFGWELARAAFEAVFSSRSPAELMQAQSRRILAVLGVTVETKGGLPRPGLLVCNHLGYLDVLVIAATVPARFIAKNEVRGWPIFGSFARRYGTLFVERGRRASIVMSHHQIRKALTDASRHAYALVLFPEGTSSGGEAVLPFKSALLEPAIGHPVQAAHLRFELPPGDGSVAEEVCYWKDMSFVPHLWHLLGMGPIRAQLTFASHAERRADRKVLAAALRATVAHLAEESGVGRMQPGGLALVL